MSSFAPIFYSHSPPDSASRGGHMPRDEPSLMHGQPGDETNPAAVPGTSPRSHGTAHSSSISSVTSMPSSAMNSLSMAPLSIPVENSPFFDIVCNRHCLAHRMQPTLWKSANWHPPPQSPDRLDYSVVRLFESKKLLVMSMGISEPLNLPVSTEMETIDKISRIGFMVFCNRSM